MNCWHVCAVPKKEKREERNGVSAHSTVRNVYAVSFQMLTHDGFIIVSAMHKCGGVASRQDLMRLCIPRLAGSFKSSVDNAILEGHIKLNKAAEKSDNPKKHNYKLTHSVKQLNQVKLKQAKLNIARAIDRKNFHANYQAVRNGKRAKRDPFQHFLRNANPQDRHHFIKDYESLNDTEREAFCRRIARFTRGSR